MPIRTDMQTMLLELQKDLGKTIVFITHDFDEALRLGDGIVILCDGSIVQRGSAQDILLHPADDDIQRFVKDVNRGCYLLLGGLVQAGVPGGAMSARRNDAGGCCQGDLGGGRRGCGRDRLQG